MILKKKLNFILALAALYTSITFSKDSIQYKDNLFTPPWNKGHMTFQLGPNQGKIGKNQHINIQDLIGDTFIANNERNTNVLLGFGYYLDGKDFGRVKMSYGMNAFYLSKLRATGEVIQENLFTNLSYSYLVTNLPIFFMIKSLINLHSPQYALTLDAGVGPNFMNVYDFEEQSLDGGITIPNNTFSSRHHIRLSGTLGIGLKIDTVNQISVELGYRFFYLGEGDFKPKNDLLLSSLKTGHIHTNAIILAIVI